MYTIFEKFKKSQLFEKANDAYTIYWCLRLQLVNKLRWNKLLCSWEIVHQDFERKESFAMASYEVLREILTEAKTLFSLLRDAYKYNIDAYSTMFATFEFKCPKE